MCEEGQLGALFSQWALSTTNLPIHLHRPSVVACPQLHRPVVAAAGDPPSVHTDIYAEDVAGMAAEGFGQGPVVGGEDVDVFVEPAGDEEGA